MNIAFVNWWTFNTVMGGLEAVGARVAQALIARGHRVCFAAVEEGYPSPEEIPAMLFPDKHRIRSRQNREALLEFFRRQGVECIVCHNAYRHRLALLLHEAAVTLGVPLIFEVHTTPDYFRHKVRAPRLFRPIERWQRRTKTLRQWRLIHRLADRTVFLSTHYISLFADLIGLDSVERLRSIPNPNTFSAEEIPETMEKENILLFVGRFEPATKRPELLLKAWSRLEPRFPDWSLHIVGGGSDREVSLVRHAASALGLQHVVFEGVQRPLPYLLRAKLLALVSSYEGWGMVLTEAMQAGVVPVAIRSYAALGEILDEGRAGLMVESDDPAVFATALASLMTDEETRRRLSAHAREYVRQFDIEAVTSRWEALLVEVIDEKHGTN